MTKEATIIIYAAITISFGVWSLYALFRTEKGSAFFPGKQSGEIGCLNAIISFLWIIFTLIYGGIFWW